MRTVETVRVVLRPYRIEDAEAAFAWTSDPAVMRYIPLGSDSTLAETQARLQRYIDHQDRFGFSKWLALDRQTGVPIGDAGLVHFPDNTRIDLGYRLIPSRWGAGLATELAAAWIAVARPWFGIDQVHAFTHVENIASRRVLEKVGFSYVANEMLYGMDAPVYSLTTT